MEENYDDLMRPHLAEMSDAVSDGELPQNHLKDGSFHQLETVSIAYRKMLAVLHAQLIACIHASRMIFSSV